MRWESTSATSHAASLRSRAEQEFWQRCWGEASGNVSPSRSDSMTKSSGGKSAFISDRNSVRARNKSMRIYFSSVLAGMVLLFTSCERRSETVAETRVEEPIKAEPASATSTFETAGLDRAIQAYRTNPTEQNKAAVDKAFAELDVEIAELKQKAVTSTGNEKTETERKLADLQAYRDKQRANYTGEKAKHAAASAGEAIKDATEDVGRAIEKTGQAIKDAID
jgi:hypothetical protein